MIPTQRELELEALLQNEQAKLERTRKLAARQFELTNKLIGELERRERASRELALELAGRIKTVIECWWLPDWVRALLQGVKS